MKTTLNPNPRTDQIDREQFLKMVDSAPFRLLTARVVGELERARSACERAADPTELHRAQGAAMALRAVLNVPSMILQEMKAKVAE